jgi:hypothetical protein
MQVLRLLLPRVHRGYVSSSGCPCVCGCCDVIEAQIWNLLSGSLNYQLGEGDLFQKVSSSLVGDCWQLDICFDLKLQNTEKTPSVDSCATTKVRKSMHDLLMMDGGRGRSCSCV